MKRTNTKEETARTVIERSRPITPEEAFRKNMEREQILIAKQVTAANGRLSHYRGLPLELDMAVFGDLSIRDRVVSIFQKAGWSLQPVPGDDTKFLVTANQANP